MSGLERKKREFLALVDGWSPARLGFRPAAGGWSAAEVFDHVVKTEERILALARQGLAKPHRIGLRDRLRYLFIERLFQTNIRVKVPSAAAQVLPGGQPDFASILERWEKTRADLADFQLRLTPDQSRMGIFRHPVCGWMGMPQILGFFSAHMVHHGFQLARLRAGSRAL